MLRSFCCFAAVALIAASSSFAGGEGPRVRVSKETTHVTGPVSADGRVNFVAAVEEKARDGVTPANNAFVPIARAVGAQIIDPEHRGEFFDRLGIDPPPDRGEMVRWEEFSKGRGQLGDQFDRALAAPWTEPDAPAVTDWLRRNADALDEIVAASERPQFYIPLVGGETVERAGRWGLPWIRDAARLLQVRAMRRLANHDTAGAAADLLTIHRLARLVGKSPLPLHRLVALGVEGVAVSGDAAVAHYADPSLEAIRVLRQDLKALGPPPGFAETVGYADRLDFLDLFQDLAAGGEEAEHRLGSYRFIWSLQQSFSGDGERLKTVTEATLRQPIDWDEAFRSANRWYDRIMAALGREDRRRRLAALEQIELQARSSLTDPGGEHPTEGLSEAGRNARILVAAFAATLPVTYRVGLDAETQMAQRYDLALTALALGEFRARHGRYPEGLERLVPEPLPSVPSDRFSGDPIRYRMLRGGRSAKVYSVGPNGVDEGDVGRGGVDDVMLQLPPDR